MVFLELLTLAAALLQREKRISCRALGRIFELDEACLEDLKFELVHARQLARQDGEVLIWAEQPEIPVRAHLLASAAEDAHLLRPIQSVFFRRSSNVRSRAHRQPKPRRLRVHAGS